MTRTAAPSYARTPSCELKGLLQEGFLAPLLRLNKRKVSDCYLDVHLRVNDEVHVYCGLTRLVTAGRKRNGTISFSADSTYENQSCAEGFFRNWNASESSLQDLLNHYLDNVTVHDSFITREGRVQEVWSRVKTPKPWTPFDREAVLSYQNKRQAALERRFTEVERARSLLKSIAVARPARGNIPWSPPPDSGTELDQLAIDDAGNLVIIEMKYAGKDAKSANIYYAPLQLLQYIHEWCRALKWLSIWTDLQNLIDARTEVDLMPPAPQLTGGIRAAICFGEDDRSDEVKRRYYEVLGIVNAHLPSGVQPVETWCYGKGGPRSL